MDLFGGLSTPRWLTNEDIWNKPQAQSAGDLFLSGLAQGWQKANDQSDGSPKMSGDASSANRSNAVPAWLAPWSKPAEQRSQQNQQFDIQKDAALQHAELLNQNQIKQQNAAKLFQGVNVGDAAQVFGVTAEHPWLMFDPATAGMTKTIVQEAATSSKIQNSSLAAKTAVANNTEFVKGLSKIAPEDAAAIQGMKPNPDGSISAMQWQALRTAQQTAELSKENTSRMAQIEALARGDVQSTEITAKGDVIQKFTPPKADSVNKPAGDWIPKTVNFNGKDVHFLQGPKGGIRMINEKGDSVEPTASELTRLSTSVDVDKELKQLATEKLKQSFKKPSASTVSKPSSSSYKSADDVRSAVSSGKLTREQGLKILKEQFNFQ